MHPREGSGKLGKSSSFRPEISKIKRVSALLQSVTDCVQAGTLHYMKRQLARVLNRQSLLFEAEGNSMMQTIIAAAAREALVQAMKTGDATSEVATPITIVSPSRQDFDNLIEPWYR